MKTNYNLLEEFFNYFLIRNSMIKNEITKNVVLKSFHQSPNKKEGKSSVNLLKNDYGINSDGSKIFKTPLITMKPKYYNKGYYFLSIEYKTINLNIVCENLNKIICNWSIDLLYKSFQKKNYNSVLKKEDLIEKINNSELGVKFNVSKIKDHGTLWRFLK